MTELENVFIRGSKIRHATQLAVRVVRFADRCRLRSYILLPDMLKNAPMFKKAAVAKLVRHALLGVQPAWLEARALTSLSAPLQGGRGAGGRGGRGGAAGRGRVRNTQAKRTRAPTF